MIDESTPKRVGPAGLDRWRLWWLGALALVSLSLSGFLVGRGLEATPTAATPPRSAAPSAYPSMPLVEATRAAPPKATPPNTLSLLRLSGSVPTHGSGTFRYASTRGPVLGGGGALRRFRVAVENGSGEDVAAFAEQVEATLGDPRSWIGGRTMRLQLVSGADPADFTVYLATRDTAGLMCRRGGVDIRIGGVPYTSCRATGKAIINLDRWRLSAKPYVYAKVPLAVYRQYVINHEVGHELGHRHEGCPRAGGPAPVMVQQTLTTRGCVPYAWPRHGSHFLTGPQM